MRSQRAQPRQNARLRVRSRHLPGFRAMSLDMSQTGLQLETDAPMQVGQELDLDLEFDSEDLRNFAVGARVVWSAADERGRSDRFRTGLVFVPENDEQRTALARTATVLQARSEADLETLLEEAKRIDPERAETFERVRAQSRPASGKSKSKRVLPLLGVYIPLQIVMDSYHWDRQAQLLVVRFSDEAGEHRLYFPHCRLLTDYGCAAQPEVEGLFCTPHSDVIKRLPKPAPRGGWKHYRFLRADRQPLLELVSAPCRAHLPAD